MSKLVDSIKSDLAILDPLKLEIINESHKHKGHGGWNESGETHFHLLIVSEYFINQNKLQRHKKIYQLLAVQLKNQIHALSIQALTPEEYTKLSS